VTKQCEMYPVPNPFSTRYIRPGAIGYLFEPGDSAEKVVRRLADFGRKAQIIGPHGSGKSTLVAELLAALGHAGKRPLLVALHDGERSMPRDWVSQARALSAGIVVVDGYEQLSYLSRWRLNARCRRHGWGLLVTSHKDVGLPTLSTLAPDLPTAQQVVERLLSSGIDTISRETVAECFASTDGNMREMLFTLYDRYEGRGSGQTSSVTMVASVPLVAPATSVTHRSTGGR